MSTNVPVALVNMPFSSSRYPSIQLGTLASLLKAQGIGVKTYHLYLHFAYQIGPPLFYERAPVNRMESAFPLPPSSVNPR